MRDIFKDITEYTEGNHYVDVADKVPVFICSVGAHLFNTANRCSTCDFDPGVVEPDAFVIDPCPLRHHRPPFFTPMSRIPDTRLHILMRGQKGSGKSVLVELFLGHGTGLLWNGAMDNGIGFRVDIGPNSITEAGMFGSVDEEGEIVGRPLARELCGGFLGFEEFSSLTDASKKDHSMDMKNQLLTSTDNGRVKKIMKSGWVEYTTRYTVWAGTQPGRFELESGLDRRFFIIDIGMDAKKELAYKRAAFKQANMTNEERYQMANKAMDIKDWFIQRQNDIMDKPPLGLLFDDSVEEWLIQPQIRSHEMDLYRRLMIGYHMMQPEWQGGVILVSVTPPLRKLLDQCLSMRRTVMDADMELIKTTFWGRDVPKSQLLKEVQRMVTQDYQAAKRWIEDNMVGQSWYYEFTPVKNGAGRPGVYCRIGEKEPPKDKVQKKIVWGKSE